MSDKIQLIIQAVNEELATVIPKINTEANRTKARVMLLQLEKICKKTRQELMKETKEARQRRKEKRMKREQQEKKEKLPIKQ